METKKKEFLKYIQNCIDEENVHGICSFEKSNEIDAQLKKDRFL